MEKGTKKFRYQEQEYAMDIAPVEAAWGEAVKIILTLPEGVTAAVLLTDPFLLSGVGMAIRENLPEQMDPRGMFQMGNIDGNEVELFLKYQLAEPIKPESKRE